MRRRCFAVAVAAGLLVSSPNIAYAKAPVWSVTPSPNPAGATKSELLSVSCSSTTFCVAVGDSTNDHAQTSVERWNGGSWAIMHSLDPTGVAADTLAGVSCPAVSNCFAVGSYSGAPVSGIFGSFVEQWNGRGSWTVASTRLSSGLAAVSCASPTNCFAVSDETSSIEHWDGNSWSVVTMNRPPVEVALNAVSCRSPISCFAAGRTRKDATLIERFV